ncbi:MAG: hypothetical protein EWV55_08615 [Microcystis viridis Mv_BB_P_19951000_S69]|uniref:Uncharacterized protein n=1 Tax=Microcystis viridis Mv_BB_P_19951000_S68D TaxID=2486270 RepID=A0A552I7L4_MICVR|nr:MAG: hypothetical protein EWV47_19110 [Microcystis viridis Mv_BB_P_19951000_S68]TRU75730.1 MAG: hypothetical protein EWV55_08615 [Microcystis viridis Mv_BB_P_19951000_S69]TRU79463.1 MAG: hypothetical protein EWV77_02740 [Microcystis viridis Mv_BB_P_19951000_S68D]TRU81721.1 MAG: hypothetical protein EWV46_20290 [Microcystis viridis Mv_BB_P_19951000_S69D]
MTELQPLPTAASDFCQSTQWGCLKGNSLLKLGVIGDFFAQSPRGLAFGVGCLHAVVIHLRQFKDD